MAVLDLVMIAGNFFVMVAIGVFAKSRIRNWADFFTAGGRMPW